MKTIENRSSEDKSSDDILSCVENAYLELAEKFRDKSTIIVVLNDEVIGRNYARIKAVRFKYTKKK